MKKAAVTIASMVVLMTCFSTIEATVPKMELETAEYPAVRGTSGGRLANNASLLQSRKLSKKTGKSTKANKNNKSSKGEVCDVNAQPVHAQAMHFLASYHSENLSIDNTECTTSYSDKEVETILQPIVDLASEKGYVNEEVPITHESVLAQFCPSGTEIEAKGIIKGNGGRSRQELIDILSSRLTKDVQCVEDIVGLMGSVIGLVLGLLGIMEIGDSVIENIASVALAYEPVVNDIIGAFAKCASPNNSLTCYAHACLDSFISVVRSMGIGTFIDQMVSETPWYDIALDAVGFTASITAFVVSDGLSEVVAFVGLLAGEASLVEAIESVITDC